VAVFLDHDWEEAGRQFHAAMARDPVPPSVSHYYGFFYLLPLGRAQEASEALERALKEDPLNVLCRTQLAVCYWTLGRHDEASRQFRQALDLNENFNLALMVQTVWHASAGRLEEALALAERASTVAPGNAGSIGVLAGVLWRKGDLSRAEGLIQKLGDGTAYGAPMGLFVFNLVRSEMDEAAEWAAKAIEQRDPNTLPGVCGPNRKDLQASGHWPALVRLLNLPEART
jgi:tetratricopeptide (TPR) repeat protein